MKELKEIRLNGNTILLEDNLVKSSILPEKISELTRDIIFRGDTIVEGPIFARRIEIQKGNITVQGATFAQNELYVNTDAVGNVTFEKAVASADSIVSRASKMKVNFFSDINAKSVALYNAYVAGSIYADEITLENCVVIGGVFATQELNIKDSIVGTFNTPMVKAAGNVGLLLPSAFSVEKMNAAPGTLLYNYTLADLGALYRGEAQSPESGKIRVDINADEVKSQLVDDETQKTMRCYTVVGKVLAADLLDTDRFHNHFLITAASLGPQLLRTYDLGENAKITPEKLRDFFYGLLTGKIDVQEMSGKFDISQITSRGQM